MKPKSIFVPFSLCEYALLPKLVFCFCFVCLFVCLFFCFFGIVMNCTSPQMIPGPQMIPKLDRK